MCAESACTWSPSCSLRWSDHKCAEDFDEDRHHPPSPRVDRDTMHASSAYSIPQIARRTHSSAVSGPTFDGCSCRWTRSASMPASLLNLSSTMRSIAAKNTLNSMVVTLGQQYNVGEKTTVILYTSYINRYAGTPDRNKTKTFLVHMLSSH